MKKILLFTTLTFTLGAQAQMYIEEFETPVLPADSMWYGNDQVTDGDTIYFNQDVSFELNYNSGWNSFTGFAVSSMTDSVTPGYGNQFSAITAVGANASNQYGICYVSQWSNNRVFLDEPSNDFYSVQITNTTYAYRSMESGDAFGKPFGADTSASGVIDGTNGEDWFLLTIYALGLDSLQNGDSINFYLADYTFAEDSLDYIVNAWETVDLYSIGGSDVIGLDFVLSSSDTTGGFGMNTPSYFAMDDLMVVYPFSVPENAPMRLEAYPNPTNAELTIKTEAGATLELYDLNGRLLKSTSALSNQVLWNLEDFESGIYMLTSVLDGQRSQTKIVKQ